jgi:hypothetical protein
MPTEMNDSKKPNLERENVKVERLPMKKVGQRNECITCHAFLPASDLPLGGKSQGLIWAEEIE